MRGASVWLLAATGCRSLLGFEDPQVIDAGETPFKREVVARAR